jgi:hypothetical protein
VLGPSAFLCAGAFCAGRRPLSRASLNRAPNSHIVIPGN